MADIFVSYASSNREWARLLAEAVGSQGWTIWWDRDIPIGTNFQQAIAGALSSARCISVLWSREAISSQWVLEEAAEGKRRNILFPILLDDTQIPFGFSLIQAADLSSWNGDPRDARLDNYMKSIGTVLGAPPELPFDDAVRRIQKFCQHRKIAIQEIEASEASSSGSKYCRAWARDRLGAVYCHVTGSNLGEVFYVRRGIAIYYHDHVGGPTSQLGLPISNEELADTSGFPTSYFQGGYIEWSPTTWEARAVTVDGAVETQFGMPARV